MSALAISGLVFLCTIGAALAAAVLRRYVPHDHLVDESRDVVKLVMGLVATMSALVLGLLIASSKNFYDTQSAETQMLAVNIIKLDGALGAYGGEATPVRAALRDAVELSLQRYFQGHQADAAPVLGSMSAKADATAELLRRLSPRTDDQRMLKQRASDIVQRIAETRLVMMEQVGNALDWPFLVVLVFWISVLFFGFGLFTPVNATVVTALTLGALSASAAVFLILEMSMPFDGLIRISGQPLRQALALIGR